MKCAKIFLLVLLITAMIAPASAAELQLDTLLLTFGRTVLTVNIDGEFDNELSGVYAPGDVVSIVAPAVSGKTFSYWTNGEGAVISYNSGLSLTMYTDTVVNAVYGTSSVIAQPVAEFLLVTRASSQILLNAIATAPSGKTITASGIRYSSSKSTLEGLNGSNGVTNEAATASKQNWLLALPVEDATYYAVAYVEVDGQTYYSEVKTLNLSDLSYGFLPVADILNELLWVESADKREKFASLQSSLAAITFNANNGSGAMAPQGFVNNRASVVSRNTFTRNYYDFAAWNTKADGTGTSYQDEASVTLTGDTTLYAQWKAIDYTLSYDLQGGTLSTSNPTSYNVESVAIKLNNPSKAGYTFDGWTGTSVDSTLSKDVIISTGSTGNRTYTANFTPITYTLTYDLNGGSISTANPTSYDIETATFTLTQPTKTGYTFEGWTGTGLTGATKVVTIAVNSTGNRSYKANWTLIQYDVSFDLNGGVFEDGNPTSYNSETDTFTLKNPTRDGYEFIGWNRENESELSLNVEIQQGTTGNLKFIANWKTVKYSLNYELNGGTVSPDNPVSYDIESKTFTLNNPTLTGYTFKGWTGTSLDAATEEVTITHGSIGDRSYTAEWMLNIYTLSYDLNGGTVSPDNPEKYTIESEDIKLIRPTKKGYSFTGWSFDNEISIDVTLPKGSTGNREYQAEWKLIKYSISYDLNGGSVSSANPTSYDMTTAAFKLTNPTKTGYTFAGWMGTSLTETSMDIRIPIGSAGNREYTATWTAVEYTISYTLNNGSVSSNLNKYTIESEAITLNNPTKNGYTFTGWTGTGINETLSSVTIAKGSTGNREYTANFSPITYTISYELNGGTNNAENPTSYTIESATITLKAPTRDGYNFGGWTFNGEAISEIAQGSTGNKTLTATWVETHGEMKPVISPASYALTVYKGQSSSLTLNATGTNLKWDMSGSLPIGMTFSSATNSATISGTPEMGTSGSYVVTVTATNAGGSASSEITITVASDFAISGDVEVGTLTTVIPESARSQTTTQTVFRNGTGQKILTADIAITTESDDFEAVAGNPFTTTVKVDVTLNLSDTNYDGYEYSMSITGLPEWLSIEGDLESTDILKVGESTHSHEFILTGTPTTSSDAETFNLTATVKVSGDIPTLEASGSKEVKISVATPEPESISEVLQSLSVKISGNETLTTNAGTSASIAFTVDVNGSYSNGLTKTLSSGSYVLTWNASNAEGFSFSDGTLIVKESASVGMHELQITATAVSNDVTGTDSKTVIVTVREATPGTVSETPNTVQVSAEQISNMTDDEIAETFAKNTNVVLTGNVAKLSETIARLETLTDIKTLDLSQITGVSELKLENTKLESITLEGNQSITKVEITGNETLTTLNLSGSKVETVDAEGCKNLVSINVEGAENLTALNVTETKITTLNVKDCAKLEMVNAKGCSNLEEVNLNGCESLEYLDVSETAITELNITGCVKLGTLYCASCDIKWLNFEGCDNLETLDCSNNSLVFLDASRLNHLRYLECRHQQVSKPLTRLMNFADLLLGLGSLGTSATDESKDVDITSYSANVKNLKAYNEAGNEITSEYDTATGEIKFSATPSRITYDYYTGFEDVMMDVEVIASEDNSYVELGSSGSGCASGLGIGALAVLMFLLVLTSKTKITK